MMDNIKQINIYEKFQLRFEAKNMGDYWRIWNSGMKGYPFMFRIKYEEVDNFVKEMKDKDMMINYINIGRVVK